MITVCCICHRVEHEGEWLDPVYDLLWHLEKRDDISHGYCPECAKKEMKKVDEWKEKNIKNVYN